MADVSRRLGRMIAEQRRGRPTVPRVGVAQSNNGDGTWQVTIAGDDVPVPASVLLHVSGLTINDRVWLDYTSDRSQVVVVGRLP